jgi:hypothetical protein
MADEFGGVEAPEVDAGAEVDVGSESTDVSTEVAETTTQDAAPEETGKEFRAVKDGRLDPTAKAELDKLKATNPQLAKAVQRALFAEDRLRRELPGGFKEVAQLRQSLEQLGGETGIQEMQGEVNGWREFDNLYTAGDPKVLEFLTETPEAQEAFLKVAPAAFAKFQEINPEGYSSYVSQVFVADMQAEGIPLMLERLQDFIGDNPKAQEIWGRLAAYVNRIGSFAKNPVAKPAMAKQATGPDPERQKFETEREQFTQNQWKTEAESQHGRIFGEAWKRLAGGVPKEKVDLVRKLYGLHLTEKLAQKKDFDGNMGKYFKAKQKDGFLRLHDSTFKEVVPLALRSAMLEAGVGARKAAAALKPGLAATPGKKPAAVDTSFVPVPQKPNFAEVNRALTSAEMFQQKRAILRNGKKVSWS